MTIIKDLSCRLFRIPPTTEWKDATHKVSGLEYLIVEVETEDGVIGTGLTYTVGVGGTAIKSLLEDYCFSVLVGRDVDQINEIWELMWNHLHRTGSGGINTLAIAAIDIALWDIWAKKRKLPLAQALGGAQRSVPAYGSGIDLFMNPSELKEHLSNYLQQGYRWVKIKVGRDSLNEDLERLAIARELIGSDGKLLLDANQCWTLDEAIPALKAFEKYHPYWIEEPLLSENIDGHRRLREVTCIPVALGESLYSKRQVLDFIKAQAVDIIQADVARVGGFTEWMKIAHLADAHDIPIAPHYLMELSIHALCAVPNGLVLENVTGGSLESLGIVKAGLPIIEGRAVPPEQLGHGLEIDYHKLEQYEVDPIKMREENLLSYDR